MTPSGAGRAITEEFFNSIEGLCNEPVRGPYANELLSYKDYLTSK